MTTFKFAFRSLTKTPFISAIAVFSLALGLGANAGIFTVFESLILRSLPVPEPDRLVALCDDGPKSGSVSQGNPGSCVFSHPMFRDLERVEDVFEGVAAYRDFGANLSHGGTTLGGSAEAVSGSYFPMLGVRPALGRLLDPEDDRTPGAHNVAVLSHDYWQSRFDGDPGVLNSRLTLNGQPLTIIGVAGPGFRGTTRGSSPDVFVPLIMRETLVPGWKGLDNRRNYWAYAMGRLADGVTLEQAQTAANQRFRQIIQDVELPLQENASESFLEQFGAKTLELRPANRGQSTMLQEARTPLLLLFGVTGFVLLIACANVANLLLTKAVQRSGEIALRMSLGARRFQVVAQLLTESLVLSVLGGLVGWAVALVTLRLLTSLLPSGGGGMLPSQISGVAWVFFAVLTLVTSLVGLAPALRVTRPDLANAMKAQTSKASGTRAVIRFRMALAVAQIAISMSLLVAAGLFMKSLLNVSAVDLGMATSELALIGTAPEYNGYTPQESRNYFARLEEEVDRLPGVRGVTGSMVPLIDGSQWMSNVEVEGYEGEPDEDKVASFNAIGPDYFSTLGVPLVSGREFTVSDDQGAPPVVIVNEAFARRFELGREAVGRFMRVGSGDEFDMEIVGLVADSKYSGVRAEVPPMFYTPYRQDENLGALFFYVRTAGPPDEMIATLRSTAMELDPNLPVDLKTVETQVEENVFLERLMSKLSAGFALVATLLAAVGLYGTLAYSVAQRSGEIGLRMALGADAGRVRRMVLRQVGTLTAVGAVLGVGAALGLGRAASSLLYELEGNDPAVLIGAAVLLVMVALGSGLAPAIRASRIDPMIALREE